MNITSIDLELNQPSNKIIEIGICIGNIHTGEILHKESIYVNPKEKLNPFIIQLTGIPQAIVDSGVDLVTAYNRLAVLHKQYESFVNPLVWGHGDIGAIQKVFTFWNKHFRSLEPWGFGRRYIDAKTLYVSYRLANKSTPAGGLAKALTKFGLKFDGKKHSAIDDAYNTFVIYREILNFLSINNNQLRGFKPC